MGILHGDISVDNIIIIQENGLRTAILDDWDLCRYKDELKVPSTTLTRQVGPENTIHAIFGLTWPLIPGNVVIHVCIISELSFQTLWSFG